MLINNETMLRQRITEHEGKKQFVYKDSLGYYTVGIGRCLDQRIDGAGLSDEEIQYLLSNDIAKAKAELQHYTWYQILDEVRRGVLIELCFNMGLSHLLTFKEMLVALSTLDYEDAAKELLDSLWAKQVGINRSQDLANRLRTGKY